MRFSIKQRGAFLAKGKLLVVQFEALFEDDLYFEIAKHKNEMTTLLKNGVLELCYKLVAHPSTNLIFVVLPNRIHEKL